MTYYYVNKDGKVVTPKRYARHYHSARDFMGQCNKETYIDKEGVLTMGTTVEMRVQHKDNKGEWHFIEPTSVPCNDCGCAEYSFYCRYAKRYAFHDVLTKIPGREIKVLTDDLYLQDSTDFINYITLSALDNFDWDQEVLVKKGNRQGLEEGMHKCSEISEDFIKVTLPQLRSLAEKYGGPENIRINFWFDC